MRHDVRSCFIRQYNIWKSFSKRIWRSCVFFFRLITLCFLHNKQKELETFSYTCHWTVTSMNSISFQEVKFCHAKIRCGKIHSTIETLLSGKWYHSERILELYFPFMVQELFHASHIRGLQFDPWIDVRSLYEVPILFIQHLFRSRDSCTALNFKFHILSNFLLELQETFLKPGG